MNYKELLAVEEIDRDEMTNVVGGGVVEGNAQPRNCWGAVQVATAQPGGQAHDPGVLETEQLLGVTSIGRLIKAVGGNQVIKEFYCPC